MSISVNGQSCVPPGFRFHPTEEELLNYYLRKKVRSENIDLDVIRDVDLNKLEPWEIQEKCKIGSGPEIDWYFFSHKDNKYPTGTRTNRATTAGFWKATGRDKVIYTSCKRIGMRKTLVFYKGRAPHGQKSDWIMHEYRLDENPEFNSQHDSIRDLGNREDGWVVCRVFKKKNLIKGENDQNSNKNSLTINNEVKTILLCDDALDQILQYMGRSCKQDSIKQSINTSNNSTMRYNLRPLSTVTLNIQEKCTKLPALESPTYNTNSLHLDYTCSTNNSRVIDTSETFFSTIHSSEMAVDAGSATEIGAPDWVTFDRLLASHLNCQSDASKQALQCFEDMSFSYCSSAKLLNSSDCLQSQSGHCISSDGGGDGDLWSLTGVDLGL